MRGPALSRLLQRELPYAVFGVESLYCRINLTGSGNREHVVLLPMVGIPMVPKDDEDVTELSELSSALSHFQDGMAGFRRKLKKIETSAPSEDAVRNSDADDREAPIQRST
jgi:hypothetical protein